MKKPTEKPSPKPAYPSDEQDKFMLRLPLGMRDKIKSAAASNNRSMNAEILALLQENYPEYDATGLVKVVRQLLPMSSEDRAQQLDRFKQLDGIKREKNSYMISQMKKALQHLDNMDLKKDLEVDDVLIMYFLAS
jgi:hypothetical protein